MEFSENNYFSSKVINWFKQYGRKNLPWQQNITAYRVWISEVMLQQTQVGTVIPYYDRFIEKFPDLKTLAQAKLDEVLKYWSGLGYYSRARNLHKTAQIIATRYSGNFPDTLEVLTTLPGIGRSTAGAILSIAMQQNIPILDGNVKRVLTRYFAIQGWPGNKRVETKLWQIATQLTPYSENAAYTQAMMDLGATLCTRSSPKCNICPITENCQARITCQQSEFPHPKPKKNIPIKTTNMLIVINEEKKLFLQKRPPIGIWGGLWCFPQTEDIQSWCQNFHFTITQQHVLKIFRHTFSHFHLDITPYLICIINSTDVIMDSGQMDWYEPTLALNLALPAPVKKLIETLVSPHTAKRVRNLAQTKEKL